METIGLEDELLGDRVCSAIVLKPNSSLITEDLFDLVRKEVETHYKVPRMIEILPFLPRGVSGKVIHSELKSIIINRQKKLNKVLSHTGNKNIEQKVIEIASNCLGIPKENYAKFERLDGGLLGFPCLYGLDC